MSSIQLDDLNMFYEQLGVGEPLIFLHSAYSRGILAFSCQLLDFQQHYTCYLPDFRGHGRTTCDSLAWSTPQLAEDILSYMDRLGIARAHLVGYSLGGNVGLYCAANGPEKVKSLITIGTSGVADPTGADDFEPEQLLKNGQQGIIDHMIANHAEAHRGSWQEFMRQSARDWRLYPQLTDEQLGSIRCPCLFIAGEKDPFTREDQLQRLCALVKYSRYLVIAGCTHRPHMLHEEPQRVNQEILEFLKSISA
jgi:pimeloyl-ACP methyl ester carboxylesterase